MCATLKPAQHALTPIDEIDAYPGPGAFLSYAPMEPFKVFGVTVQAFNRTHAEYRACKQLVRESSGEEAWCRCAICHQNIRWLVLCHDGTTGQHFIIGRDCAGALVKGLPTDAWDRKRKLRDIKEIETKRGKRFVHSREVPQWFWDLPREQRPAFVSVSCYERPDRHQRRRTVKTWSLSVWGESVDEVLTNIDKLDALAK